MSDRHQISTGRFEGWCERLTAVPSIVSRVSGGSSDPPRAAAVELPACSTSCIGAAGTMDGLRLDDEVADQFLRARGIPLTRDTTAEVKNSAAGGLHERSESAQRVTLKDPRK